MLSFDEFVRFYLLYQYDHEVASDALRKVAEWKIPHSATEQLPEILPEEAFAALTSPEANENFAQSLRADDAEAEAGFIIGKRVICLPNGRKARPTANGFVFQK